MSIALIVVQAYLSAILGISGVAKLHGRREFASTLFRHQILPKQSILFMSWALPIVELMVSALLLSGIASTPAAIAAVVLFASFLAIEATLLMTKRAGNCGCYGVAFPQRVDGASIIVSVVLLSLASLNAVVAVGAEQPNFVWRLPSILVFAAVLLYVEAFRWRVALLRSRRADSSPQVAPMA